MVRRGAIWGVLAALFVIGSVTSHFDFNAGDRVLAWLGFFCLVMFLYRGDPR